MLSYNVKADVGCKIAQLGSRLIDSTARKLAAQFFSALRDELTAPAEAVG
jgi:carbon monoxide dehydrogenase subunit G